VTLTNFSSGVSTYNAAHYSEVGLLSLEVQDSNYGNASIVIPSTPLNIGRFIPEHFKQTVAQDGLFRVTCGPRTMFAAYLDEVATGLDTSKLPITASMNTGTLSQNDLTALPSVVA